MFDTSFVKDNFEIGNCTFGRFRIYTFICNFFFAHESEMNIELFDTVLFPR